jgi:hypothetical protein
MLIWLVIFMNAALSGLQFFRAILTTFCCAWVLEMIKINTSREETHRFIARVGDGEADILLRRRTIWVKVHSAAVITGHPGIGKTLYRYGVSD